MNIFGFGKKKKEPIESRVFSNCDEAKKGIIKNLTPEKVLKLKAERKEFAEKYYKDEEVRRESVKKEIDKKNTTCPKCGSNKITDKISRNEGHLEGHSYSSSSGSLFGFSSSGSGSIKGDWDTNLVNKCGDCSNEWKKEAYAESIYCNHMDMELLYLRWYCSILDEIKNIKFDPLDLDEKCNSLEEKKSHFEEKLKEQSENIKRFWGNHSIELIELSLLEMIYPYSSYKMEKINFELLTNLGFKHI